MNNPTEEQFEEIAIQPEEFKQTNELVAEIAEQEGELVDYIPKSKLADPLETLTPRSIAFEQQKSLDRLTKEKGNLENYVRTALKYRTTKEMTECFKAEQVDAIALGLHQIEKGQGLIIADQTGIGKGRQAAAIIRYAILNGYLPIFFTRSPHLFTAIYNDLKDIDFEQINPFILNTDEMAVIKENGRERFKPLMRNKQEALLQTVKEVPTTHLSSIEWHKRHNLDLPKTKTVKLVESIDYLPSAYDVIFSTYSQISSAGIYKQIWLRNLMERGVKGSKKYKKTILILDESHMVGNYTSKAGIWFDSVQSHTAASIFLSATYLKTPQVMPLYAKNTVYNELSYDSKRLVNAFESGGRIMQEIGANGLAESGQLINRQRSFDGVTREYVYFDQEPRSSELRKKVNTIIELMNQIVAFEQDYITPLLDKKHKEALKAAEGVRKVPAGLGVKTAPYFSRVFNIIDQMIFSAKVEDVAELCIDLLNEDKKVVIAFRSTMGAFMKDLNLENGSKSSIHEMDFLRTMQKGLDSTFKYFYTDITGSQTEERLTLADLDAIGLETYQTIQNKIKQTSSGLSVSPIDQLIYLIEKSQKKKSLGGHNREHFKIGEVTGRDQRINIAKGNEVESYKANANALFDQFNSGDIDVLFINQSGSTGLSAHASSKFKDQRIRAMVIHQFELEVNTEVQKWGRIHRTGQVELPEFYYAFTSIPIEARLMSMLKGKFKSLFANTTGSQKTHDDLLESPDLFNKYGDAIAWIWISENYDMMDKLAWPTYVYNRSKQYHTRKDSSEKEGAMRQLSGRAGLLSVQEQESLFNELLNRYNELILTVKQNGTYDLETEFLRLDAQTVKRFTFQDNHGGASPFGRQTLRDEVIINNLTRPYRKSEIDKLIVKQLDGKKAEQYQNELLDEIEQEYPKLIEAKKAKRQEVIQDKEKELNQLVKGSGQTEAENEVIRRKRKELTVLIEKRKQSLNELIGTYDNIKAIIVRELKRYQVGQVVKVPVLGQDDWHYGIFLGVGMSRSAKNPYTFSNYTFRFAVADGRKRVEYNLTPAQRTELAVMFSISEGIDEKEALQVNRDWNDLIKEISDEREKRHMLTNNLISASKYYINGSGKLIRYNTVDSQIKTGILLSADYGSKEFEATKPIEDAKEEIENLEIGESLSDLSKSIKFTRKNSHQFGLTINKKQRSLYQDTKLRSLIKRAKGQSTDELPDFVLFRRQMTAELENTNLEAFLNQLSRKELFVAVKPRELEDWELENVEKWDKENTQVRQYRYKLKRPFGKNSNPTAGFVDYEEPTKDNQHGVVIFNRPLSDKERFGFGLRPLFKSVEEPYFEWKKYMYHPDRKGALDAMIKKASMQSTDQAISQLGRFILNNPHEEGNREFVFGSYGNKELGRAIYDDMVHTVSPLKQFIKQLAIELSTSIN